MSKPGHDIIVKVGLTPDQYLALKLMADDEDIPQSSFMRRLLIDRIKSCANDDAKGNPDAMPGHGQEWA